MSTKNPIRACVALHKPTPPGHISSAHGARKNGTKVRMNVAAHHEKGKNEKTGRRREKTGRFKRGCVRSFKGQHGKKMVCVGGVHGVNGTLGHFNLTQTGLGTAPPR